MTTWPSSRPSRSSSAAPAPTAPRVSPTTQRKETAIHQVVSDAVTTGSVIDIHAAPGIDKPDISIIEREFARRLSTKPHPNLQIELLKRLLNSDLKTIANRNLVTDRAMRSYTNRSLTAAEVIAELVELGKQMRAEHERGDKLGLREDELAFYDAVYRNHSGVLTATTPSRRLRTSWSALSTATPPSTETRRSRSARRCVGTSASSW